MSMNIAIYAKRDIFVPKIGRTDTQTINFGALQTPTEVSYKIIESSDPLMAYIEWVRDTAQEVEGLIYADDDVFCTHPIKVETYNPNLEHLAELYNWLSYVEDSGYIVYLEIR